VTASLLPGLLSGAAWRAFGCWLALCAVCWPVWGHAQTVQPVPALTARVLDQAQVLSAADRQSLELQLQTFEQQRGAQIVVVLVSTTQPEDIADYTQRLGDAWKLGRQGVGDGLLFVVAVQDRRMRIAPNKALEGAIPDLLAKQILDQVVAPSFKQGDYAAGVRAGLLQLQSRIEGEALPLPAAPLSKQEVDWIELLIMLAVIVPMVSTVLRRMLGKPLGALAAAGAAGFLTWNMTALIWAAALAVGVGFRVALVLPGAVAASGARRWGRAAPGPGGSGDGDSGPGAGGFSSGGGGNAGGGGASGNW
jgi:uncharacterized protein